MARLDREAWASLLLCLLGYTWVRLGLFDEEVFGRLDVVPVCQHTGEVGTFVSWTLVWCVPAIFNIKPAIEIVLMELPQPNVRRAILN